MITKQYILLSILFFVYSCSEDSITNSSSLIKKEPWIETSNLISSDAHNGRISINCLIVSDDNSIIAGTEGYGIFRSTDSGKSWENVNDEFLYVICFSKNSNGQLFAGLWGYILRSDDNGKSWINISDNIGNPHFQSIYVSSKDIIFAGSLSGFFISNDNGYTWSNNELLPSSVHDLVEDEDNNLYAAVMNYGGIFKSSDDGVTWYSINNGLKSNQTSIKSLCVTNYNEILLGTWGWGLFKSNLDSINWQPELKNVSLVQDIMKVNNTIFASTDSLGVIFKNANEISKRSSLPEEITLTEAPSQEWNKNYYEGVDKLNKEE